MEIVNATIKSLLLLLFSFALIIRNWITKVGELADWFMRANMANIRVISGGEWKISKLAQPSIEDSCSQVYLC